MNPEMQDVSELIYLFHQGQNLRSYEIFGAHKVRGGWLFRVWAPGVKSVSLVGEFNGWNVEAGRMRPSGGDDSIWEYFSEAAREGDLYKYAITTGDGRIRYKADPYAFSAEPAYKTNCQRASAVWDIQKAFPWRDESWMRQRDARQNMDNRPDRSPVNIYRIHVDSRRHHENGRPLPYSEIAAEQIPYAKEMKYTHISLPALIEYDTDESHNYETTGYYAITSRYGTPDDFRTLVDAAHHAGIGVIMDWTLSGFSTAEFGLEHFTGDALYEIPAEHEWAESEESGIGSLRTFDCSRPEVSSFLLSNALFLAEQFHLDGFRVRHLSRMLYRKSAERGGDAFTSGEDRVENRMAISLLQNIHRNLRLIYPGFLTIAEESTAWPNVTADPSVGGLGFTFKQNDEWQDSSETYFRTEPHSRGAIRERIAGPLSYAYSEHYILPLLREEPTEPENFGIDSIIRDLPGEFADKAAEFRALLAYMYTFPGKKMISSMTGDFRFGAKAGVPDQCAAEYEANHSLPEYIRELNRYYRETPALWEDDDIQDGFRWIPEDPAGDSVYAYYRKSRRDPDHTVVIVLNLSGRQYDVYDIPVPDGTRYVPALDTDARSFGGEGIRNQAYYTVIDIGKNGNGDALEHHISVQLPKLSALILERKESL